MFLDIFPILQGALLLCARYESSQSEPDPVAFEYLITHLMYHLTSKTIPALPSKKIDVVVGLDARGFLLGPLIALRLGASFVPVRKQGKLPGKTATAEYVKEYGTVSVTSARKPCAALTGMAWQGLVRDARGRDQAWSGRDRGRRSDRYRFVLLLNFVRNLTDQPSRA